MSSCVTHSDGRFRARGRRDRRDRAKRGAFTWKGVHLRQELGRVFVGGTPDCLTQIDRQLLLGIGRRPVGAVVEKLLDNLDVSAHGRPMQRRIVSLQVEGRCR